MVSKEIEEKILNFIAENNGTITKNDVVAEIDGQLSKPPTFKLLDKLENEQKRFKRQSKRSGALSKY
jgi:hypothetical protein